MTKLRVLISIFSLCTLCSPAFADEGTASAKVETTPASKATPETPSAPQTSPAATTSEPSPAATSTVTPTATPSPPVTTPVVPGNDDARAQFEASIHGFDSYLSSNNPFHVPQKELDALVSLRAMTRASLATIYVWQQRYSDAGKLLDIAIPTLTTEAKTNKQLSALLFTSYTNMAIIAGKASDYDKASQYIAKSKQWKQVFDKERAAAKTPGKTTAKKKHK